MPELPVELSGEVRRTLADLRRVRLAATAWPAVAGDLARLHAAIARGDAEAVRGALVPISQATFEGKVRGRLAGAGSPAALVVGTKSTRALPIVGGVSALLLVVIGYLLGGWLVAGLTAVLAAFIFGVALAGTHTTKDRLEQRRARQGLAPSAEPTEPAPKVVTDALGELERRLSDAGDGS
jgi:hypothetical protein